VNTHQCRRLYNLFHGRRDIYCVRRIRGGEVVYLSLKKVLLPEVYGQHVEGDETIAIYPLLEDGTCHFAAIDIDTPDFALAKKVATMVPQPNYLERSRSGNFHIWMFFEVPVDVRQLEQLCRLGVTYARETSKRHCNLYPLPPRKEGGLGLVIALPLQRAVREKGNTLFINDQGEVYPDQMDFISGVERIPPRKVGKAEMPDVVKDPELYALWAGRGKKVGDQSNSGYDYSFCLAMSRRGFNREAMMELLRSRPLVHSTDDEYITRTVDRVVTVVTTEYKREYPAQSIQNWEEIKVIDYKEFIRQFTTKLIYDDPQQLDMFFAAIVANRLQSGRPVWLLIIGPPGCGKSLPMMAARHCPELFMTSAFRPTAMISGWGTKGGDDPSLIPKLNEKVLLVKDMSSLLSQHKDVIAEVLGLLRDAYDGYCQRSFGTGITRGYKTRFGFIGAATGTIDAHWKLQTELGERFLRYRIRSSPSLIQRKVQQALDNVTSEVELDDSIAQAALGFLRGLLEGHPKLPELTDKGKLGRLAQLGAVLRTPVSRSSFKREVLAIPAFEEATRYAAQLAKMAIGLAYVRGKEIVGVQEFDDVRCLVRDGLDSVSEAICHAMFTSIDPVEAITIAEATFLPSYTIGSRLDDLVTARIVLRTKVGLTSSYSFVPWIRAEMEELELWKERVV